MKKYETLIFDLDDTLIDNIESVKYAFKIITKELNINYNEELFRKWKKADDTFWHKWSHKELNLPNFNSVEEEVTFVRAYRFQLFFNTLNLSFDNAVDLNEIYCDNLGVNIKEIEGAKELIKDLSKDYEISIASNGPREAADNKIKKLKLNPYISSILTSGEIGIGKPNIEFFNILFEKLENKDKNKMMLIGDSLTTDIQGGMNAGIDTCWFNPDNKTLQEEYKPTTTINKLLELKKNL